MYLCYDNPALLSCDFAPALVKRLAGRTDARGITALIWLLTSANRRSTPFGSSAFASLWSVEAGMCDERGRMPLQILQEDKQLYENAVAAAQWLYQKD